MGFHYKITVLCWFVFSLFTIPCGAQSLTVSGTDWNLVIPPLSEAGRDYAGIYTSLPNQILLTASLPLLLANVKISAHYEAAPSWHNNLKIAIRRTGTGVGLCVLCGISGNENYITLSTSDLRLFTISSTLSVLTLSNIPMQLQLSGVSVSVPVANYKSRVVFTISSI